MSRIISVIIPLIATLAFMALAPVAAASEGNAGGLVGIMEGGVSIDRTVVIALGAGFVIAVIAVAGVMISEMLSLVRNPIVRSGRRPTRR